MSRLHSHPETHMVQRIGWLRAAVLGANDGIVSTASLILGVAAAAASKGDVLLAGVAGLVAGAMSMAAGEYVSVSSQSDTEQADLARERRELREQPEFELDELAQIYVARGLEAGLAREVAQQLMAKDALAVHARDALGISEIEHRAAGASRPRVCCNVFGRGSGSTRPCGDFTVELAAAHGCRGFVGLPRCAWGPGGSRRRRGAAQADYSRDFLGSSRHGPDHGESVRFSGRSSKSRECCSPRANAGVWVARIFEALRAAAKKPDRRSSSTARYWARPSSTTKAPNPGRGGTGRFRARFPRCHMICPQATKTGADCGAPASRLRWAPQASPMRSSTYLRRARNCAGIALLYRSRKFDRRIGGIERTARNTRYPQARHERHITALD